MTRAWVWLIPLVGCAGESGIRQAESGQELYEARCALCHDQDGAIGVHLDAPLIRSYGTALALYNYTKFAMPYEAPRSLADAEYWALTAYLLRSRGLLADQMELGPENAAAIEWPRPEGP